LINDVTFCCDERIRDGVGETMGVVLEFVDAPAAGLAGAGRARQMTPPEPVVVG